KLILSGIRMVTSWHSEITENELRKKCQVKAKNNNDSRNSSPFFAVTFSRHFWPPEMDSTQISHHCATNHDVMEVCYNKIRIMHMHINCNGCQMQTCETSNNKK